MSSDAADRLAGWLREQADRPLGAVEMTSNRTLAPVSHGLRAGAENLLAKATRALRAGDRERAAALVERAASMPFDEHEETAPAAWVAHMQLFSLVVDALEGCDDGDEEWLDCAIEVLDSCDPDARLELRDVLSSIDQDYRISPAERKRLRAATATVPAAVPLSDRVDLLPGELAGRVTSILYACLAYEDALEGRR